VTRTDHDVGPVDSDGRTGLNRRQMIKAAGIAGAAAWTAPMIIDSLSSPAAAVTVSPGCYRFYWSISGTCSYTNTDPNSCAPADAGCTTFGGRPTGAVTATPTCPANDSQSAVAISVLAGISCRITSATAVVRHGEGSPTTFSAQCRSALVTGTFGSTLFTFGAGNKSVTITPQGTVASGSSFDQWRNGGGSPLVNSSIGIVLHCP
jgi:hypothetical protein